MAWIKRNLFFVIGAVIAVGLLAAAGFYDFKNWQRNKAALDALNQAYATLQRLNSQNPSPGNDKIDNIKAASEQEQQLRQWIQQDGAILSADSAHARSRQWRDHGCPICRRRATIPSISCRRKPPTPVSPCRRNTVSHLKRNERW